MNYPALAEVRKNLRVDWYRCPIDPAKLRAFSKRSDVQGGLQVAGHLGLFTSTGALVYYFWLQEIWLGFALALFAHGSIASFFSGVAPHELGHGTVFRTKALNTVFLYVFSFISWWDPFDYACSHTYHHRYTQYPNGDRENVLPMEPSLKFSLVVQLFTINLFTQPGRRYGKGGLFSALFVTAKSAIGVMGSTEAPSREWLQALHRDQPDYALKSMWWSRILLFLHGSLAAISVGTGLWVVPLIITVPSFIANWGAYLVGLTQHCGLRDQVADFRKNTRSIRLNPFVEFLYWRMNWHIEHHMFAGVPCYNLKRVHDEVADDMPRPRTLFSAWQEMRATWRRQHIEPDYQFDTPLPAARKTVRKRTPSDLEISIGELAPDRLKLNQAGDPDDEPPTR